MLTIEFSVARMRFALSCLWEAMSAYHVLQGPEGHTVLHLWARAVRPALDAAGLRPGGDSLLAGLIPPGPTYTPDFLTPPPTSLAPDLDAELDVLRATPHEVVRAEIGRLAWDPTPSVRAMAADPDAGLARVAGELRTLWDIAIAPHWRRMRALLEAEVFHRARVLAAEGAVGLLNSLHERVGWEENTLSIAHKWCSDDATLSANGLLLVPTVFVWPAVRTVASPDNPQLAYPPRGVGTLWETPGEAPAALAAVLGKGRARLLVELSSPASTTDLAQRTGMTPGGVSQHLRVLREAGLITPHRLGHSVLNIRTPAADTLLGAAAG
ncbi:ArsR/SmtB family transcription factor [Phytomonospora endophytica]|uniref:ArsR family transcriptional regulator n=1 Tax=Phytomonospora endophytica TaxID=714109 RepID=A0A841FME0_9ACTN|nr:DUF5937 family protein [Phytomonospora endophytica]MBB6037024.1 hypothetical protein [Phytomonospora endophytica]GIG69432.1 transcriptional regulator [Phytomonospora endophytica]